MAWGIAFTAMVWYALTMRAEARLRREEAEEWVWKPHLAPHGCPAITQAASPSLPAAAVSAGS